MTWRMTLIGHQVAQVGEAADMFVEGRRGDAGPVGHGGETQRVEALLVDQGERDVDHRIGVEPGPRHENYLS